MILESLFAITKPFFFQKGKCKRTSRRSAITEKGAVLKPAYSFIS